MFARQEVIVHLPYEVGSARLVPLASSARRDRREPGRGVPVSTVLGRRLAAEFLGTGLLVTAVVGSGIMASRLSPGDVGLQLLENSIATLFALGALILIFGPVSGGHFNPVVSAADWWLGRREGTGLRAGELAWYTVAQVIGAIGGAILGNVMYALAPVSWSTHHRTGGHLWLGEVVATAGLILLIFALARSGRASVAPAAIGAYIGAACWFTSSTSFANPAVTIGRAFTDTFAGIAPASLLGFIVAQLVGAAVGVAIVAGLYPQVGAAEADVVVPGDQAESASDGRAQAQGVTEPVMDDQLLDVPTHDLDARVRALVTETTISAAAS